MKLLLFNLSSDGARAEAAKLLGYSLQGTLLEIGAEAKEIDESNCGLNS
jgi:hypothetical protein